jgi:hypothetical protein
MTKRISLPVNETLLGAVNRQSRARRNNVIWMTPELIAQAHTRIAGRYLNLPALPGKRRRRHAERMLAHAMAQKDQGEGAQR